jgi:hypothetical protein
VSEIVSEEFNKKNLSKKKFFLALSSAGLSAGQRFWWKTACLNKIRNYCCGSFKNNLSITKWSRKGILLQRDTVQPVQLFEIVQNQMWVYYETQETLTVFKLMKKLYNPCWVWQTWRRFTKTWTYRWVFFFDHFI